jgi:hypothetical protein
MYDVRLLMPDFTQTKIPAFFLICKKLSTNENLVSNVAVGEDLPTGQAGTNRGDPSWPVGTPATFCNI